MNQRNPGSDDLPRQAMEDALQNIVDFLPQLKKESGPGDQCPNCRTGRLDYDGTLNLVCPDCGFTLAGCFT